MRCLENLYDYNSKIRATISQQMISNMLKYRDAPEIYVTTFKKFKRKIFATKLNIYFIIYFQKYRIVGLLSRNETEKAINLCHETADFERGKNHKI